FKQFALTIAASTLISAFNSLTLSPALCAILLKGHGHGHEGDGKAGDAHAPAAHAQAEALPRLAIVVLGGLTAYVLLAPRLGPLFGIESSGHGGHGEGAATHAVSASALWAFRAGVFAVGAVAGWFASRLVNKGFA